MILVQLTSTLKYLSSSKQIHAKYISKLTRDHPAVLSGMEKRAPGFLALIASFDSDIRETLAIVDMANGIEVTQNKKRKLDESVDSTTGLVNIQERLDNALKENVLLKLKLERSLLTNKNSRQAKEIEEVIPTTLAVLEASQLISDKRVEVTKLPLGEKHKLISAPTSKGPMIKLNVVHEMPSSMCNIQRIPDNLVDDISVEHHGYTAMVGTRNQTNFQCLHGEMYEVVLVCQRKERLTIPSGTRRVQFQRRPVSAENVLGLEREMNRGTQSEQVTMLHYACEWIYTSVQMYEQVKDLFEVSRICSRLGL